MAQDKKVLLPLWLTVVAGDHRCHKPHAAFSHFFPLQIRFCVYLYIHTLKKTQTKPYGLPSTFCYIHRRRQTKNCCGTKISEKEKTSFSLASALPSCSCTKHLKHEKVLSCDTDHLLISYLHILKRTAVSSCVGAIHPSWPMGRGTSQPHAQPSHKIQRPPLCYSDAALLCLWKSYQMPYREVQKTQAGNQYQQGFFSLNPPNLWLQTGECHKYIKVLLEFFSISFFMFALCCFL